LPYKLQLVYECLWPSPTEMLCICSLTKPKC